MKNPYLKAHKMMENFIKEKMKENHFSYNKRSRNFSKMYLFTSVFVLCQYDSKLVYINSTNGWCLPVGIRYSISQDFHSEKQRKNGNKAVHKALKIIKKINEECKNKLKELLCKFEIVDYKIQSLL